MNISDSSVRISGGSRASHILQGRRSHVTPYHESLQLLKISEILLTPRYMLEQSIIIIESEIKPPSSEMRHISCLLRVSLLSEMGQRAQIFISETLWLPLLKCLGSLATRCHDSMLMLTKPCPQKSSCFPALKHTAWDALAESNSQVLHWGTLQGNTPFYDYESCGRE